MILQRSPLRPKPDIMSDLPPSGFTIGGQQTMQLSMRVIEGAGYNYGDLDPRIVTYAKAAATTIRSLMAEIAEATLPREIQIGRELLAIKARLGHGHFGPWLTAEFGWSDRQARRFMRAAQGKGTYTGLGAEGGVAHSVTPSIAFRHSIDAFMTKPETASRLYRVALTKLAEDGCFTQQEMNALWLVEPSAGTGNFFNEMPKDRRIGIDINPLAPDIIKADFLTYELPFDPTIIWGIIGNTPFRNGMTFKVIDRAARLGASFFGLILPHTILRPSMRNKIDSHFHCIHHEVLPEDSFLRDGQVK